MTKGRHSGLDANQIVTEAQKRWLHTDEICGILHNYKNFPLAAEPANMPPSGSFFLFNRKELRCFRKDGYNWTKKKRDGKTVMEGHEKLKLGGIGVLNCYYAHREENKNFQRRSYWLLQGEPSHVVLVHYLEVKGKRKNFNRSKETEEAVPYSQETEPNSEMDFSVSSCFLQNNYQVTSQSTDTTGLNSAQALELVNTESAGNHQASSGFHPFFKLQQPTVEKFNVGLTDPSFPGPISDDYQGNFPTISGVDFASLTSADTNGVLPENENPILEDLFIRNFDETWEFGNHPQIQKECQTSEGKWPLDQNVHEESVYGVTSRFSEQVVNLDEQLNFMGPCLPQTDEQEIHPMQNNLQVQLSDADHGYYLKSNPEINMALEGKINSSFTTLENRLDGSLTDELKKLHSFNQWMSKELGDVNDSHMQSSSGAYWDTFESENRVDESNISPQVHLDNYTLGPSLSQDQLFSIIDFSPNWAYEGSKVKVLITGRFLKSQQEVENCKWSCMFGEVEVPAEVIADSVIQCHTPVHKAASVPFYVTCSNRLACSEVREFEYRVGLIKDVDIINYSGNTNDDTSSGFHSLFELQQPMVEKINAELTDPYFPGPISDDYQGKFSTILGVDFASLTQADKAKDGNNAALKILDFPLWEDVLGNGTSGTQAVTFEPSFLETIPDTTGVLSKQENPILGQHFTSNLGEKREIGSHSQAQKEWQASEGKWHLDQNVHAESVCGVTSRFNEQDGNWVKLLNSREPFLPKTDKQDNDPMQSNLQVQLSDADHVYYLKSNPEINMALEGKTNSSFFIKKTQLDGPLMKENLRKLDSFNRWMSKELGDVNESHMQSSSEVYWDTVDSENRADESNISPQVHLDNYTLGLSLTQDQLFSIIDFAPNWAYEGSEVKVLITGRFLKSQQEIENCKWSCMFGEVEVPAEVIADGVIRCHTPVHKAERVPFYVTCSNRVVCSEVREFEYRVSLIKDVDIVDNSGNTNDDLLMRFKFFLSLTSAGALSTDSVIGREKSQVSNKISSLLEGDNDEWDQMLKLASEKDFSPEKVQDKLLEKLLKEKLHVWLLQKAAEDGKGPSVLDENGQGVLHFAAALGYDWALEPTIIAGVSVNFRDVNGWTALHWAAFCGRERTVVSLVSLDAAPGALTDPSPKYPSGRTAADLASAQGHKGIAGYLAESHLSTHLSSLKLDTVSTHLSSLKLDTREGDAAEISGAKAVQNVSERSATPVSDGDLPYGLSLKDSLAAVCNASQAFARIYQVFRVESFNKKQLKEYGDDTFGMSDEQALSLLALKTNKSGQHDLPVHAAAIRIQNKFRSWKGRREFLIIRQRIVKIQAHVRGHQVRKNCKKFTWSVGIIGKIILRWRRKGSGLRGFKSEALTEGRRMQDKSSEDDYDFLKEGRKQTEQRLQKALARVKSMALYPDARDQYHRLLNVVTDIQGSKVVGDGVPSS